MQSDINYPYEDIIIPQKLFLFIKRAKAQDINFIMRAHQNA